MGSSLDDFSVENQILSDVFARTSLGARFSLISSDFRILFEDCMDSEHIEIGMVSTFEVMGLWETRTLKSNDSYTLFNVFTQFTLLWIC